MTWAGFEKLNGLPKNLPDLPKCSDSTEVRREFLSKHIGKFVDEFVLTEFDVERAWMEVEKKEMVKRKAILLQSPPVINQLLSVPSPTLNH